MKLRNIFVLLSLTMLLLPNLALAVPVHNFACEDCHSADGTIDELGGFNICLECHGETPTPTFMTVLNNTVTSVNSFVPGDASNQYGNNPYYNSASDATSHMWAGTTTNPAAGAAEPSRTLYPGMFGRYGTSNNAVNCSRCHDPHIQQNSNNPKLLRLTGDNITPMTSDELCQACHIDFAGALADQSNRGLVTHPLVNSAQLAAVQAGPNAAYYTDMAGTLPLYNASTTYNNSAVLVEGGVSCQSCHGIHHTDSDADTQDGPQQALNQADGLLLRMTGPAGPVYNSLTQNQAAQLRSNLCQSCHNYQLHGVGSNKTGCLDCHGGHSYNGGTPSSFVLADWSPDTVPSRVKKADGGYIGPVDFPVLLDATSTRDTWADENDGTANGFCEKCHGDVNDMSAGGLGTFETQHQDTEAQECIDCHAHSDATMSFALDASAATCGDCHGFPPYKDIRGDRAADFDARDGGYAYYNTATANFPGGYSYTDTTGTFKLEDTTAHQTHAGRDLESALGVPVVGADGWYFVGQSGIDNCKPCHGVDASKTSGGHKVDPVDRPGTFFDVPFDTIATGQGNLSPNYDEPNANCDNVYCHTAGAPRTGDSTRNWTAGAGPANTPAWDLANGGGVNNILGSGAARCRTCHGNDGPSGTDSFTTKGNTLVHIAHIEPTIMASPIACGTCHVNTAIDATTLSANATDHRSGSGGQHVNGVQDVAYNASVYNAALLGAGYDSEGAGTGTCSLYCHDVPDPDNPTGTGRFADWDDTTDMNCDSCHGGLRTDGTPINSSSHPRHVTDANGPQLSCDDCHDINTESNTESGQHTSHVDGLVDVIANICIDCHGYDAQTGEVLPEWGTPSSGRDCATCHAGYKCGTAFLSGESPPHLEYSRRSGHNRPAAGYNAVVNYPESDNVPADADCDSCHVTDSANHWDGTVYAVSGDEADLLLRTGQDGYNSAYLGLEDNYCLNCHGSAPAHPTNSASATTRNIQTHTTKKCVACHNVHGEASNIQMIWSNPLDQNQHDSTLGQYAGSNVVFTNTSDFTGIGLDSYDEDDGDDGAATEDNADDICAVCHSTAFNVDHNNIQNTGTHSGSDNLGIDCFVSCHAVHSDSGGAFLSVGGTSCDGCHGYPPATGAHAMHSVSTNPDGSDDRSECAYCHTGADSYTYSTADDQGNTLNHSDKAGRRTILAGTIGYAIGAGDRWNCTKACHNTDNTDGFWYTWDGVDEGVTAVNRLPVDSDGIACDKCHYYSASPTSTENNNWGSDLDGRAEPISAAHNEHFDKNKGCGECHDITGGEYNNGSSIAGPLAHIDDRSGADDNAVYNGAALALPAEAGFDEGGGVRDVVRTDMTFDDANTCSGGITTGCHGSADTANWDTPIPADNTGCVQCHTDTTDTSMNPTSGLHDNTVTMTVTGNAHDGDFDGGNWGANAGCVECHTTQPTVTATDHINGTLQYNAAITYNASLITYNPATNDCTTSCHSVGTTWTYKWSDTVYNADGTECANCHGDYASGWTTGVQPHEEVTTRGNKHSTTGDLSYPCSDCHAIGATTANYTYNSVNADWNFNAGETSNHGDGLITLNQTAVNTIDYDTGPNPDRVGCLNTGVCHNTGGVAGDTIHTFPITNTGLSVATVTGDEPSIECYTCHGGTNLGGDTNGFWPRTPGGDTGSEDDEGEHTVHITALAKSVYNSTLLGLLTNDGNGTSAEKQVELCSYCHDSPGEDIDHSQTLPAEVNSMFTLWLPKTADDGVYYNSSAIPAQQDTCATVDCHFNVTTTKDVYGWYDNSTSACAMCHSVDIPTDPAHIAHTDSQVNGYGRDIVCADCHDSDTDWDLNVPPSVDHIDGNYEVAGGTVMDGTLNTYNSASFNSCGTNDCHNAGNGDLGTAPAVDPYAWGTDYPDSCVICHAALPTVTTAHAPHINNTTYVPNSCDECHTVAANTNHINAIVEYNSAITAPASNSGWDQSCTNDCHDSAFPSGTLWNSGTVVDCLECHSGTYVGGNNWRSSGNNYLQQTGLHDEVPVVSGITHDDDFPYNGGASTGNCESCHSAIPTNPATAHVDGNWGMTYNSATNSVVNFATDVNYADAEKPTCSPNGSLITCHFDSGDWSRTWIENSEIAAGNLNCAGCHGYWATGSDGSGWRTGTSHAENPTRGSSGNHNSSAPNGFDCYACHVLGGTTPAEYPWTTGTNDWKPAEAGTTLHGDGNITRNSNGVTDNEHDISGRSGCTACHEGVVDLPPAGNTHDFPASTFNMALVNATDPVASGGGGCDSCHGGGGNYWPNDETVTAAYPNRAGTHPEHMAAMAAKGIPQTERCTYCHPFPPGESSYVIGVHNVPLAAPADTHDASTTFYNSIINKAQDVDAYYNTAEFFDPGEGTCSNMDCHFNNSYTPHWYDDNVAPEAITYNSAVAGPEPGSVSLNWFSPGDDADLDNTTAYSYEMRYGPSLASVTTSFNSATLVGGMPITYLRGELTEHLVTQLVPGDAYYFNIRTYDTAGNRSALATNPQGPVTATLDDASFPPEFHGIDNAFIGDEGAAVNLWWTAAEDHSMFDASNPSDPTPITYKIWMKDEAAGTLDMDVDPPIRTGWPDTRIELDSTDGIQNDHVYWFGVRACDFNGSCETNTELVSVTPVAPPTVEKSVGLYNATGGSTQMVLGGPQTATATPSVPSPLTNPAPLVFYGPTETYPVKYFVDSFSIFLEPTNSPPDVRAQIGTCDGSGGSFAAAGGGREITIPTSRRVDKIYNFKLSDGTGVDVPAGSTICIGLTAEASINATYGTVATGGSATITSQITNVPPGVVTSASAILQPGPTGGNGALVNIQFTEPTYDTDGLDNATEDPLHYDIYGSVEGVAGNWDYVIYEEYPGTGSGNVHNLVWDTQAAGLYGNYPGSSLPHNQVDLAIRIRSGDGFTHTPLAIDIVGDADPADDVPPGDITDLQVKARPKSGTYQLRWTCPGDDFMNNGRAAAYEIRYAASAITDQAAWDAATPVDADGRSNTEPIPDFGKHVMEMEVTGLLPDTTYWFAIRTLDEAGNESGLSNTDSDVSGPRCGMCHTTGPSIVESEGNHKLHGYTLADCAKCHGAASQTYGLDHQDGYLKMGWGPSGPVNGTILGSRIVYTDPLAVPGYQDMYDDTDGFGGFGDPIDPYVPQGDGLDDGGCFNFGRNGISGCHGSAGDDPDGGGPLPLYNTPIWQGDANLDCARCHGNPLRTTDVYGREFDGTLANGSVVPDQILGSPTVDNRGNWDDSGAGTVDERKYIGQHEKHLNYSFRFSKGDSCNLCHQGHYTDQDALDGKHGDGVVDLELDLNAAGPNAHYNAGTTGNAGTCYDLSPFSCHPSDAEPKWDTNDPFPCIGCHTMNTDINKIGHYTDPFGGITETIDPTNDLDGFTGGLEGNCTWCHFAGHPTDDVGGTALILPNNSQVGISYKSGGIHLRKNPGNLPGRNGGAGWDTQAELCWGCHDENGVSEWGSDKLTVGTYNSANIITRPRNLTDYDYGFVTGSNWTTATWSSSYSSVGNNSSNPIFEYKTGRIQSTHSTNIYNGVNSLNLNTSTTPNQYEEVLDNVEDIRCHNCHDVHNMNFAPGDQSSGNPYLRGSWVRNPYQEDGAPSTTADYTVGQNNYGPVPRAGTAYKVIGGFQIDQNNVDPTYGAPTSGLGLSNSGGLCTLCHGSDVDALNNAGNGDPALWYGTNGHSNAAIGGSTVHAADILRFTNNVGILGRTPTAPTPVNFTDDYTHKENPMMGYINAIWDGTLDTRVDGFRASYSGKGYLVDPLQLADFAYSLFDWGVSQADGVIDRGYHAFSCSKCHNPHASRLPKLLITNCLDTKHNTWDDAAARTVDGTNEQGAGTTAPHPDSEDRQLSQAGSAQNCHRLGDPNDTGTSAGGGKGGGWNKVTPWVQAPYQ